MPFKEKKKIKYATFALLFALFGIVAPKYAAADNDGSAIKTVVIDPGHGGHDPGTNWGNGKYKEKNIVLSVSLKLNPLTTFPGRSYLVKSTVAEHLSVDYFMLARRLLSLASVSFYRFD